MIIYKILENGYFGGSVTVPDSTKGIPLWHTRTAPPTDTEGKFILWAGNQWVLTDSPPPVATVTETIVQEAPITEIITDATSESATIIEENIEPNPVTEL